MSTAFARSSRTVAAIAAGGRARPGIGSISNSRTPASKVFLEFEGMRQAGEIFLNGKSMGLSENGITAYGVDITGVVKFGGAENVLAVHVDNRTNYAERATGTRFEWNANDFNPDHGGINRHVRLHPHRPHLPDPAALRRPEDHRRVRLSDEHLRPQAGPLTSTWNPRCIMPPRNGPPFPFRPWSWIGEAWSVPGFRETRMTSQPARKTVLKAAGLAQGGPFLERGRSVSLRRVHGPDRRRQGGQRHQGHNGLSEDRVQGRRGQGRRLPQRRVRVPQGLRQRSSNEWAGLGQAYPDWMHDLTAAMIRDGHGNYVRWMHVTPQKVDVESCDRFGIVQIAPAGDKERAVQGRQWEQRLEVMTASMVYLRNSPSILFWEAGNTGIPAAQMKQMVELEKTWDPSGGRTMGCRTLNDPATTPIAEYYGVMIGQDARTDALKTPTAMFRAYSAERKGPRPVDRDGGLPGRRRRHSWDDYSPPSSVKEGSDRHLRVEFGDVRAVAAAGRYWALLDEPDFEIATRTTRSGRDMRRSTSRIRTRMAGSSPARSRVSGKVDAVRLPKSIYYAHRVMQNPKARRLHPRALDVPGGDPQDGLRDRQHAGGQLR